MFTTTKMTINFNSTSTANSAKEIVKDAFLSMKEHDFCFSQAVEGAAANLTVENNTLLIADDNAAFLGEEIIEVAPIIVKALAAKLSNDNFTFDFCTTDEYTEGWVEGEYKNGKLDIKTTYYPEGYCEYVSCPECGELVVRLDEYDPSKTYICPDCGEVVDLSESYEACAPEIKMETITIK